MIIRPNAILVNVSDSEGKRWNVIYIRGEDGKYTHVGNEYTPTPNPVNLDPFVNWSDLMIGKGWVHPAYAKSDGNGGWYISAYDTYNQAQWDGKETTLEELNERGVVFACFDSLLDRYKNMSDEELETVLKIGKL